MKKLLLSTVMLCALTAPAIAQEEGEWNDDENFQLVSDMDHLKNTGWGVYRIDNSKCSVQTRQNDFTLSYEYAGGFPPIGKTKISHDNWHFENAEDVYLNVILKTSIASAADPILFKTAYDENYLEAQNMDATPDAMNLVLYTGAEYVAYIVDFKAQPDIKFDMSGLNSLIPIYATCVKEVNPNGVHRLLNNYDDTAIGDQPLTFKGSVDPKME